MVVVIVLIVLVATLAGVWATRGAGLVTSGGSAAPPALTYVRIDNINVTFTYNSTHHFLSEFIGACATVNCPFILPDAGLNGRPDIGSFVIYIVNLDPTNWTHETASVVNVTSSPEGVWTNGAGYSPVDPDSVSFGAVIPVKFNPAILGYDLNVTIEGGWA